MPRARTLRVGLFSSQEAAVVKIREHTFVAAPAQVVFAPLPVAVVVGGWTQLSINGKDCPNSQYTAIGTTLTYTGPLTAVAGDEFTLTYEFV